MPAPPLRRVPSPRAGALLLVAALATACDTTTATLSARCDIALTDAAPSTAAPGASVVLTGGPFTTVWDSAVYVDALRAQLTDLSRDNCDTCDTCRTDYACTACSDCDACDAACATDCVETATFTVPDAPPASTFVRLYNSHGESAPLAFTVEAATDTSETGTGETGTGETGASDTNTSDTAPAAVPGHARH